MPAWGDCAWVLLQNRIPNGVDGLLRDSPLQVIVRFDQNQKPRGLGALNIGMWDLFIIFRIDRPDPSQREPIQDLSHIIAGIRARDDSIFVQAWVTLWHA